VGRHAPRIPRPCVVCGGTFLATPRSLRLYCSDACNATDIITHERLAERDAWTCHICKGDVTRETWSIDHLHALAYGGTHTWENVALAHHACNSRRGAVDLGGA
jgi:5-methylcytosine-specific restriction endonuclease McrA